MKCLKDYESPFNWGISEQIVLDFNAETLQFENEVSIFNLMHSIMASYVYTVKVDYNKAVKNLRHTDSIWSSIDHVIFCLEGISFNVIEEVLLGTKLNVLYAIEEFDEANKVLNNIKTIKLNKKEINSNTLNGCKAIAWSFFRTKGSEKAISFAQSALKDNPNCSLWHFILGKNLRRLRREVVWCSTPSPAELQSLVKAYELSNNPLYGICAAQSYQENSDNETAESFFIRVFQTKPADCKIQLRLALCFLRVNDLDRAKMCLDFVESCCAEEVMFYHYKGIYFKKIHNFELAAAYFRKASIESNLGAYIQYGQCMLKVDKDYSYLFHLLNLLKKFERADNTIIQQLLLHIAMEKYHNERYEKALKYFIKGIKLSPNSDILIAYPSRFGYLNNYNIYDFVNNDLIPKLEQSSGGISEDILNDINDFKNIQIQENTSTSTVKQHYSLSNTFQFYINKMKISEIFCKFISFVIYIWNFFRSLM